MKSILSYSLVFILGLSLGYIVNIFVTNKPYHDLVRENNELKAKLEAEKEPRSTLEAESCLPPVQAASANPELPHGYGDEAVANPAPATAPVASPTPQLPARASEQTVPQINSSESVTSYEEMQEFLKATAPLDKLAILRSRKNLDSRTAQNLNGLYSGEITFFPDKSDEQKWPIEIVIEGEWSDGKFIGRDEIRLFNSKGKNFSTSKSSPGSVLKHYKLGPNGSIIVEVKGGDGFLQLYHFPRLERWSGHYFERKDMAPFEYLGHVHMFKR